MDLTTHQISLCAGSLCDWRDPPCLGRLAGGWDCNHGDRDRGGPRRATAAAEQEAARRAGSAGGHGLGRARRQSDGVGRCLAARLDMRDQWISRLLAKALIDTDVVIAPFAREVLARAGADGRTLVLIIDQSQINTEHQMVMVSLRVGGRALPLAWRVKKTSGAIGFAEQRAALDRVAALLPAGVRPVLMGDRFYGSPALIAWCRAQGWDWRLRLKQGWDWR